MKAELTNFTVPAPMLATSSSKLSTMIQMGFPERKTGVLSLCACHQSFTTTGYICPRCKSKSCDLPTTCSVCNLSLVLK